MSRSSTFTLPAARAVDGHRAAAIAVAIVTIALLAVFAETVRSMVGIWLSSETFSHGFIIVPVSLWLVWRQRSELAALPVRPFLPALPLVAVAGFGWLAGRLANANVVEHFALVLMLQSAVLVTAGWAMARALAFPLLFLFFAVPFGEAFVPRMIDWTADFTVLALKATGIPVYREGNDFAVPSGHWSVEKACSGIRYLIASAVAGALFAYVMYQGFWRRAAFFAVSLAVPIVANWLRAYLIVLIGHLSGNKLAVGVDHLIYGWVFFGIVLLLMFWVGARFAHRQDDTRQESAGVRAGVAGSVDSVRRPLIAAAAMVFAFALIWPAFEYAMAAQAADRRPALAPIADANGWHSVADAGGGWRPAFLGARSATRQVFEQNGRRVTVDIVYYSGQTPERKLVSTTNGLIAPGGDGRWRELNAGTKEIAWRDAPLMARRSSLGGSGGRVEVLWWYWIDNRVTGSDAMAKAWIALARLTMRGDDSAAIFVSGAPADRSDAGALGARFAADMGESINRALLATRAGAGSSAATARGSTP